MTSRLDRLDKREARRRFTLPDVSIVLCGSAILLATLLTQPLAAGNPASAADTPAADSSTGKSPVAETIEQAASGTVERTVFRPEIFVPVSGDLSVPIEQQ